MSHETKQKQNKRNKQNWTSFTKDNSQPKDSSAFHNKKSLNSLSLPSQKLQNQQMQQQQKENNCRKASENLQLLKQKHSLTSSEKGQAQETGLWRPGTTLIVGDSMLNGVEERKMPSYVKVRNFPGSTVRDIYDYVKPLLRKRHLMYSCMSVRMMLLILILAPLSVSSLTLKNAVRVSCLMARSPYHCQ